MKVIKHGSTIKELICPKCGCIFLAAGTDTRYGQTNLEQFFICPECGHECREEDINDEQT